MPNEGHPSYITGNIVLVQNGWDTCAGLAPWVTKYDSFPIILQMKEPGHRKVKKEDSRFYNSVTKSLNWNPGLLILV